MLVSDIQVVSVGSTASKVLILYKPAADTLQNECQRIMNGWARLAVGHLQTTKDEDGAHGNFHRGFHLKLDDLRNRHAKQGNVADKVQDRVRDEYWPRVEAGPWNLRLPKLLDGAALENESDHEGNSPGSHESANDVHQFPEIWKQAHVHPAKAELDKNHDDIVQDLQREETLQDDHFLAEGHELHMATQAVGNLNVVQDATHE